MPHVTRQRKPKRKKPKRSKALGIHDPAELLIHRELAVLRIAGGAKPGRHKDELLGKRLDKLAESERAVGAILPPEHKGWWVCRKGCSLSLDQTMDKPKPQYCPNCNGTKFIAWTL